MPSSQPPGATLQVNAQQSRHYPSRPALEVLICTHQRARLLARALDSLEAATRPADCPLGVFVVANACSDDTPRLLAERAAATDTARLPLRWIVDPVPGKSHALNLALPQARAPLIAFVDDDHRLDPGYLLALVEAARTQPEAELFCGRILPDWDGSEPAWVHDQGPYRIYPLPVPRFDLGAEPHPVVPGSATPGGGNLAIRQGLFARIGPFRLELGPHGHNLGGAEDIEWVKRAVASGAPLHYVPGMCQYHYVEADRMTLGYVLRKAYERSASTLRIAPSEHPHRWPPRYMLRKVVGYGLRALFALDWPARRFYLTRLAAALGEIKGFSQQVRDPHPESPSGSDPDAPTR
ncbi:glycosyltransferase family 2 protein [Marichromatium gracile]|uniref:GT2 family glycosyltransferase n=1 Tax=Marichromatium gracile TaxID=1048 RepID=A0A4R4A9B1_MARGR|nr:glycosyltransferase [Marichromatium gracile]MBK1707993.1 glycosyl transferase family 2 [Marichromatium gracile]MBO8084802.1 glycosyltransferase family 2 protein [Marichromatium sp.]TCW35119.1 GT2 family glycosyltransferase [Marichromatium gracile]